MLPSRCNRHLLGLGQHVKKSLTEEGIIGYQFGTVGVSDGISMGTPGMSYSLQSRDLIADSVETAAGGHWLDGMVVIPGCDKNMPGVLMAREFHFGGVPMDSVLTRCGSGQVEPPRYHGVRRHHPPWLLRGRAAARYRFGFPVVRKVSAGWQDACCREGTLQHGPTCVPWSRRLRRGMHRVPHVSVIH